MDQYFTPTEVAQKLIASLRRINESRIADFAAGDGELLKVAKEKWPKAEVVAIDIDAKTVRYLREQNPTWRVGKCDFLNNASVRVCKAIRGAQGNVSLVLLNPPFSCRGNERHMVSLDGQKVFCGRAMAFLTSAIPFLCSDGRIAAILPSGCLSSEKDARAWKIIRHTFDVRIMATFGIRTFDGCSARTTIVRLSKKRRRGTQSRRRSSRTPEHRITVKIIRGAVPIHSARNGMAGPEWPLVHTTNLQKSQLTRLDMSINTLHRYANGPSVLIPRVGEPNSGKCVLYLRNRRIVLSDCIFALACTTKEDAAILHSRLVDAWDEVSDVYGGTCARYMTICGLRSLLKKLGVEVTAIQAVGYFSDG